MTGSQPQRKVDIHYRRFITEDNNLPEDFVLSDVLIGLIQNGGNNGSSGLTIGERVYQHGLSHPDDIICWNNYILIEDKFVAGTLCLYRPDEPQAIIETTPENLSNSTFPISEVSKIDKSDFLRAISYFLVCGNHFYLIQSPSLQASAFENYLQWLLSKFGAISSTTAVKFAAKFDKNIIGGDLEDIQSITIGSRIHNIEEENDD